MQGRRREDTIFGELPDDVQPGDYWKYLNEDGSQMQAHKVGADASNITDMVWGFSAPNGCGLGTLTRHTVREHDDGTASIRPGDGSSNSVLIHGSNGRMWHGYLEHGVWQEC